MNSEMETLARRAVAAPHFAWRAGMRYLANGHAYRLSDDDIFGAIILPPDHLPDLDDDRTVNALRYLARATFNASLPEIVAALEAP